jgi:hypothetical protein
MAHWGIALALGPNYNLDVDAAREKRAHEELQKAAAKAAKATQAERDYIATLQKRFSGAENPDLKKLAQDYAVAAGELSKKYPDDLTAATLYADARMCQRPWHLYTNDHEPLGDTQEIVATLDSVLTRDPDHLGANHLYIHAVEASHTPQRALEAAARLPGLAPDCGHLVHMPSHIYALVGRSRVGGDEQRGGDRRGPRLLQEAPRGKGGFYEMMYYPHNIHFAAYAHAYAGDYAESHKWARALWDHVSPHVAQHADDGRLQRGADGAGSEIPPVGRHPQGRSARREDDAAHQRLLPLRPRNGVRRQA